LVVVGGTPDAQRELRDSLQGSDVKLQLVSGMSKVSLARCKSAAEAADLVVIWAPSPLSHAVSSNFSRVTPQRRLVYVTKRGVASLAEAVADWLMKGAA
jgi:hypothetical protein